MDIKKWNEIPGSAAVQGWPYTNLHDLNLDWIINTTKEFAAEISRFEDNVTEEVAGFEERVTVKIGEFEGTIQEYTDKIDVALATVDEKITYIDNFFSSLDVQQEINNKLDSMSADGSLAALLKPFADAWLTQDAPGVISAWLAAHITEPEGVVIDSSLTVAGAAADAKATGDKINNISSNIADNYAFLGSSQRISYINRMNGTEINQYGITGSINNNIVTLSGSATKSFGIKIFSLSAPYTPLASNRGVLLTVDNLDNPHIIIQLSYINDNNQIVEIYHTSYSVKGVIYLPDFNTMKELRATITILPNYTINERFYINLENVINEITTDSFLAAGMNYDVLTSSVLLKRKYSGNGITMTANAGIYEITGTAASSGNFELYNLRLDPLKIFKAGETYVLHYANPDNAALYLQILYDSNQIIYSSTQSTKLPFTIPANATNFMIRLTYIANRMYNNNKIEIYITPYHKRYVNNNTFYTSEYNGSLLKTVKIAREYTNSKVILDNDSYDIVSEFIEEYGESFFTSYDPNQTEGRGIVITNGMHLLSRTNAVINCDCTAYDAQRVYSYFSPLMLGGGDCIIENLTINATHCKYCIHDDWYDKDQKYTHIFKNCKLYHYGLGIRCLGGGLTNASEIRIHDCIFDMDRQGVPVSYHNCINPGSVSRGVISGCYFKTGYPDVNNYGPSTEITQFLISNNSFAPGSPAILTPGFEDPEHYTQVNMEILQFNNEIRN